MLGSKPIDSEIRFYSKKLNLNQCLITVEGTSWWRWQVKKLSDGGVFFDKRFWLLFWRMQKVTKAKKTDLFNLKTEF